MADFITQLRKLGTADLSDAQSKVMGGNNFGRFCGTQIRNLNPEAGLLCGYAVTCTAESTSLVKGHASRFPAHFLASLLQSPPEKSHTSAYASYFPHLHTSITTAPPVAVGTLLHDRANPLRTTLLI